MTLRFILLLFFVLVQATAFAQTANPLSDTLRWNASGYTDQKTNALIQKSCQFVTYGSSKIDWVQKGGALTYTLTVNSVSGNWTDANTNGSITYNVTLDQFTGTLTIVRSGTISIALNITSATDKHNVSYSISNFDIL